MADRPISLPLLLVDDCWISSFSSAELESSDSVEVELVELVELDPVAAGAAAAAAAVEELPPAIWKAMTPPKGPAGLELATFIMHTPVVLPTVPVQVVPAGTWIAKG